VGNGDLRFTVPSYPIPYANVYAKAYAKAADLNGRHGISSDPVTVEECNKNIRK